MNESLEIRVNVVNPLSREENTLLITEEDIYECVECDLFSIQENVFEYFDVEECLFLTEKDAEVFKNFVKHVLDKIVEENEFQSWGE